MDETSTDLCSVLASCDVESSRLLRDLEAANAVKPVPQRTVMMMILFLLQARSREPENAVPLSRACKIYIEAKDIVGHPEPDIADEIPVVRSRMVQNTVRHHHPHALFLRLTRSDGIQLFMLSEDGYRRVVREDCLLPFMIRLSKKMARGRGK
jgi:hypothetical protein